MNTIKSPILSRQESRRNAVGVFSIVWIIITSGGVFFNSDAIIRITLVFDVFLVMGQIALLNKRVILKRNAAPLVQLILMVISVVFAIIANSDYSSWLTYARLFLVLALAMGTSLLIDNHRIVQVFIKTVIALALISLIMFYSEFVARNDSLFPVINFYEHQYVNGFIYLHYRDIEPRNFSIFIEPGLYQIYLNLCLFALLYGKKITPSRYIQIGILLFAIYSTKSTTGYLLGAFTLGCLIFKSSKKKNIFVMAARAAIIILTIFLLVTSESYVKNLDDKFNSDSSTSSFATRKNSTLIDLMIIAENPLTGEGLFNYQNSLDKYDAMGFRVDSATNTFTQLAAVFGLPFVLLIIYRIMLAIMRFQADVVSKIVFLVLYIVCFSTEPFILYPFFYIFLFMSFDSKSKNGAAKRVPNVSH